MACFLVPAAEAVVTTVASVFVNKKDTDNETGNKVCLSQEFSEKLGRLNVMLWGGSALLAFEHVWHGEVSPFFPFLTAMSDPADTAEMFHEMSTVGVGMAVLVTCVWALTVLAERHIIKKSDTVPKALPVTEGAGE